MKNLLIKPKHSLVKLYEEFRKYIKNLLFPLYLFPIKLVTYSLYYVIVFIFSLIAAFFGLIFDTLVYPLRSMKNFLRSIVFVGIALYLFLTFIIIADYLTREYGSFEKFVCGYGYPVTEKLQNSIVRIVGGYSEGSGFFIDNKQVLTNFHVIADEPSPKIIFPNGSFVTPVKIVGNEDIDLAVLYTGNSYDPLVMPLPDEVATFADEPFLAGGYPLGTDLTGKATVLKGRFIDFRKSKQMPISYIQTDISLAKGMSGGPLVDQCGNVVGINTMSLAGLSLFINADWAKVAIPDFTDQSITKIEVDPSLSPADAVTAFYTYLKARRMQEGFDLLSEDYLKKTDLEEWTNRFTDVLDVEVVKSETVEGATDTAFVKFSTKNWYNGEAEQHHYEGTWKTVKEDGVYKMLQSKIVEVENPGWEWFYD